MLNTWQSFPMKPILINNEVLKGLNPLDYTIEPKWDGWRIIIVTNLNRVSTFTRQKTPLKLPMSLQNELNDLDLPVGTVMDGEIWSPMKRGGWNNLPKGQCKLSFWDVMRHGSKNISNESIETRRQILNSLFTPTENIAQTNVYDVSLENLQKLEQQAREVRDGQALRSGFIHGVVLKRNGSPRRDHACRSIEHPDWLKVVYWH
jgi:ATP-dependent DNA ligase